MTSHIFKHDAVHPNVKKNVQVLRNGHNTATNSNWFPGV